MKKKKRIELKQSICVLIFNITHDTVFACISWITPPVTMTSLFVTWNVVQTMTTTVVDTVIAIGIIVTSFCH